MQDVRQGLILDETWSAKDFVGNVQPLNGMSRQRTLLDRLGYRSGRRVARDMQMVRVTEPSRLLH